MQASIPLDLQVFAGFFETSLYIGLPPDLLIEAFAKWCADNPEQAKEWVLSILEM